MSVGLNSSCIRAAAAALPKGISAVISLGLRPLDPYSAQNVR